MKRNAIATVRAFARPPAAQEERCDFCGLPVAASHAHIVDAAGQPHCACVACTLLFPEGRDARYRRLESHACRVADDACTSDDWSSLGIPVGLAWLFRDAIDGRTRVQYPGAAGAVEAKLDGASHAIVKDLSPGIEAILVRRWRDSSECWRVSIDHCWRLAGLMRKNWRGMDGGADLHAAVNTFFRDLGNG